MGLFGRKSQVQKLLEATWSGDRAAVFRLVRDGVKVNDKNRDGLAALHVVAYLPEDRTGIVDNLLYAKANIDEPEANYGWTPLHIAAARGLTKVARLLISKGADVNATDKKGATPLDLAQLNSETAMVEFLSKQGAVAGTGTSAAGPLEVPVSKVGDGMDKISQAAGAART